MRDDLSALRDQTRRVLTTSWRALLDVLYAGGSPPPPLGAAGSRRTRIVVVAVVTGVIAVWSWVTTFTQPWSFPVVLGLGALVVLTALSVALSYSRPLLAWRLAVVLFAVAPTIYQNQDVYWYFDNTWSQGPFWLDAALVMILFCVAERHGPAQLCWIGGLTLLASLPRNISGTGILLLVLVLIGPLLAGSTLRLRVRANEQQLRRAEARAATAALTERARIARELHDVVAHHMSVLAVRADSAPYRIPGLSEAARAEFADLCTTARDGLTEMRRLLGVLRAEEDLAATAPQPGLGQVGELVDRVRATGAEVSLSITPGSDTLPVSLGLSAYRIVQEALSNATRHAAGAPVRVEVHTTGGALRINVRNPAGSSTSDTERDGPGHGLVGMRERVIVLGGRFDAGPTADGGFAVSATIPLDISAGAPW